MSSRGITPRENILREVTNRLRIAQERHGPAFASAHEAVSVIREELDELWDEVKRKEHMRSNVKLRNETIDIAVAALRYAVQLDQEVFGE